MPAAGAGVSVSARASGTLDGDIGNEVREGDSAVRASCSSAEVGWRVECTAAEFVGWGTGEDSGLDGVGKDALAG